MTRKGSAGRPNIRFTLLATGQHSYGTAQLGHITSRAFVFVTHSVVGLACSNVQANFACGNGLVETGWLQLYVPQLEMEANASIKMEQQEGTDVQSTFRTILMMKIDFE